MALFSLANQPGAAFRSALNTILGKLQSNSAGTVDPVTGGEQAAGMLWVDTNTTPPTLKIRNAANSAWVSVGGVDTSFLLAGTTAFSRTILDDTTAAAARTTLGAAALSGVNTFDNWLEIENTSPGIRVRETDQAVGQQSAAIYSSAGDVTIGYYDTDTYTNFVERFRFERGGQADSDNDVLNRGAGDARYRQFIASVNASDSSSIDFTQFDSTQYDAYEFVLMNVTPSFFSGGVILIQTSPNGSTWDASAGNYWWTTTEVQAPTTAGNFGNATNAASISLAGSGVGNSDGGFSGRVRVDGPHLANKTMVTWSGAYFDDSGNFHSVNGAGARLSNAAVLGVRFTATLTIDSGTITMYGLRNS